MGRIQSDVGLVTGIKITDTVDQLMAIQAQPRDALQSRVKTFQAEQTAVTQLMVVTLGVQLSGKQLQNASMYQARAATSGDTKYLTASATSSAAVGDYQFTPVRKAQNHQLQSSGFATQDQAIGPGEFSVRLGGFLQSAVGLEDLNAGAGVSRGKIRITDRSGASAVVDLRFARTIDDVLQAINSQDSINVTASAVGDRLKLTDNTGATSANLKVQEVSGGTTAADLGLSGIDTAGASATGADVLRLSESFGLNRLNDGNGLSIRGAEPDLNITFQDGSAPLEINFDDEKTLGEILDTLNAADPTRLQAELSGDGDRIVLTDLTMGGGSFAVTSTTDGTLAEDLGLTGTASGGVITGGRLLGGLRTTLLKSLNGGQGLGALGDLTLTDRSGATATVNLASAETVDDVIGAINSAGVGIQATYNKADNGILLADTTGAAASNLIVANGDATNTADKLHLTFDAAQSSKNSGELHRQTLSEGTLLSTLNGGKGVAQNSFLLTDSNGLSGSISFSQLKPKTLGDVIDAINALPTAIRARINDTGDGIALEDTAHGADTLRVAEVGSGTTAKDLKLLTATKTVTIAGQPTQVIDGTTTVTATLDTDDTLEDLVSKLNDAGGSFKASIVNDGAGSQPYHLSLLSTAAGGSGRLLADSSLAGVSFQDVVHAQDAVLVAGDPSLGRLIASSTNTFTDVVAGLSVTVQGATTDSINVSVNTSNTTFVSGIKQFVAQYNSLRDKIDSLDFFKPDDGSRGVLFGSSETLRLRNDVSRFVTGRFFGLGSFQNLSQMGVTIDDSGKLAVDEAKLKAAYDKDPSAVQKFFTDEDQGFVTKLNKTFDALVGEKNSVLINRVQSLNNKVELGNAQLATMGARLDRERERLLTTFYNLESAVSKLQSNMTAIGSLSQNLSLAASANSTTRK
jgi:flagellar hook-associated protein 2